MPSSCLWANITKQDMLPTLEDYLVTQFLQNHFSATLSSGSTTIIFTKCRFGLAISQYTPRRK